MKLVLVEWEDAFADLHWSSIKDLDTAPMISVGCLVHIDEKKVVLSSMFGREKIDDFNCVQAIPRSCIKRMRELRVK